MGIGPKVKIVGRVDLDSINEATRPAKKTKEEREAERQQNADAAKAHNREIIARDLEKKRDSLQQNLRDAVDAANALRKQISNVRNANMEERRLQKQRLEYLQQKQAVRNRYNDLTLTNDQRQKALLFYGIRPKKMDVVHFHVPKTKEAEDMDGIALCRDENHYYMAIDMYPQPDQDDNATTMMDENPDGTFDGIWPKHVVLKPAQKFEELYIRNLTEKYADDLDKAEEFVEVVRKREAEEIEQLTEALTIYVEADGCVKEGEQALSEIEERIKQMNAELLATDAELRQYKTVTGTGDTDGQAAENAENADGTAGLINFSDDTDIEYEPMEGIGLDTDVEKKYPHLPYLRGKRKMTTMNWPMIEDTYEPWLRYRLMSNIARVETKLRHQHALTYVLTEDYYNEVVNRGRTAYRGMTIQDVVAKGERSCGVIVFPSQGYEDTVLFDIDCRNLMIILVVYIRECRLMFYESYSEQEILSRPRTDHFICQSLKNTGTDPARLFTHIRNMVVSFLAMEGDTERCIRHLVEEGKGRETDTEIGESDDVDTTDDRDVVLRDYTWYTDITVNREIPVRGYISHRWCGTGKNKFIKEVWVRPYVKHGYTREAGVKK